MLTCAVCTKKSCQLHDHANPPLNCPMLDQQTQDEAKKEYYKAKILDYILFVIVDDYKYNFYKDFF